MDEQIIRNGVLVTLTYVRNTEQVNNRKQRLRTHISSQHYRPGVEYSAHITMWLCRYLLCREMVWYS